jgi:hypothetical protein
MSPTSYRAAPPRFLSIRSVHPIGQSSAWELQGTTHRELRNFSSEIASIEVATASKQDVPQKWLGFDWPPRFNGRHAVRREDDMGVFRMYRVGGIGVGVLGVLLASGIATVGAVAQAADGAAMPDAQVESNVLRQLASAQELSNQNIQTTTVYGVVTLSGNVHDEAMRTKAENLAARALGVKKVVDELTLGDATAASNDQSAQGPPPQGDPNNPAAMNGNQAPTDAAPPNMVLQSDGTYAPAAPDQQPAPQEQADNGQPQPGYGNQAPPNGAPGYGPAGPPPHQPMYAPGPNDGPYAGQKAGLAVTVAAGTPLQIRINRGLDSNNVQPGTTFTGIVLYDVVSGGAVAIPRGATVSGIVTDAKKAGTFKGRGELSLQLNSLTLGGQVYPLNSVVWDAHGRDKTAGTVNNAVGMGVLGALVGAVAGGGKGAAIGAGVGAGVGVAGSAASPNGRVILPPESVLGFALAQPVGVTTVSQQEMARLSYAAGPPPPPRPGYRRRYYSPVYGYYYGPGM